MKENKGSAIEVYDRLHGVNTGVEWDFQCIYCGGKSIEIGVLDSCYKKSTINTFEDLPEKEVSYYKNLPDEVQVVIEAMNNKKEICTRCDSCGLGTIGFLNREGTQQIIAFPSDKKLKDYLYKYYNYQEVMRL